MGNENSIALTVPLELFTAGVAKAIFNADKENKQVEDGFFKAEGR